MEQNQTPRRRSGFTLIELLVVVAIIALLIGVLLPTLSGALASARGFRCQMALRAIAFDFSVYADEALHGNRGDDAALGDRFRLETFQESQYGLDEFWEDKWGQTDLKTVPDENNQNPMRCSEVRGELQLRRGVPCSNGALSPPDQISFAFNARLHRPEIVRGGRPAAVPATLSAEIVNHANVPLAWDVDGGASGRAGVSPVFNAPALDSRGPYANDRAWFPSSRHSGRGNYAFIGGHVLSSGSPLADSAWDWAYQPPVSGR